jgi:hypothetical protein
VPEQEHAPRRAVSVDVWAWTPSEPSRLLIGRTVELGPLSAVLLLPKLPADAVQLTLRIALPDRATLMHAVVLQRAALDLVIVEFDLIDAYEQSRIRAFIDATG